MSSTALLLLLLGVTTAETFEGNEDFVETNDKIGRPLGSDDFANADDISSLFIDGEFKDDWHFENDMIFGNGNAEERTGFSNSWVRYWTNGLVPYAIAEDYTTNERALVAKGIRTLEKHTCVRFQPRSNEQQYLFFSGRSGLECSCNVGMQDGPTTLSLSAQQGCFHLGVIVHEMIHGLGFEHTHQRSDRDDYVEIHLENLSESGKKYAYAFSKCSSCVTKGLPYDCNSIMHYPNDAFAAYGKKTITSKNPNTCQTFTNRQYYSIRHEDQVMTANDIATIRNVYCETPVTTTRRPLATTRQSTDCPYSGPTVLASRTQTAPEEDGSLG